MARREMSTDPRAIRTREALVTATIDLLEEHAAHDLSVTAIVRAAGVSRQVFYEHFMDRDAVVLAAGKAIFEPAYMSFVTEFDPNTTYPQQVAKLYQTLSRHEGAVRNLMDSAAQGKINRFVVEIMYNAVRAELENHLKAANVVADPRMLDDTARFLAAGTQEVFAQGYAENSEPEQVGERIEMVRRTLGAFSMGEPISGEHEMEAVTKQKHA